MKFLVEPTPIRTYSLYDIQDRIDYFEKRTSKENLAHDGSNETLQSVLANTFHQTYLRQESYGSALSRAMMKAAKYRSLSSNRYSSSIGKRVRSYSLSNHSTMAITATTSFSEEQSTSVDYENTYFCPEETTRFDDVLSLTTITSNMEKKIIRTQHDSSLCSDTTVFQSDTEENSEGNLPVTPKINNEEQIIRIDLPSTSADEEEKEDDFSGVVHATKYTIINDDHSECSRTLSDRNEMKRSTRDNLSLDQSITLTIEANPSSPDDDDYMKIYQQGATLQPLIIHQDQLCFNEDDSDHSSETSDEIRYPSEGDGSVRHSCASDDLNNTSSTLRQEAISITKVRCKRRKTWIRSPTPSSYLPSKLNQSNVKHIQVDGRDASVHSTSCKQVVRNSARVQTTMILQNCSLNDDQEIHSSQQSPSIATNESSSIIDNKNIQEQQATNNCYSSLSSVKRLLNESIDGNIEIIQMDEQECVLEIVDGVLTIVPKDKSTSSSIDGKTKKLSEPKYHSAQHQQRSSSIASSISSPSSLSEHEQEREDYSSTSSSHLSSKVSPRTPMMISTESSADVLDLFSIPIVPKAKIIPSSQRKTMSSIPRSSSPIATKKLSSLSSPTSIKDKSTLTIENQTRSNKTNVLSELLQAVKKTPATNDKQLEARAPPPPTSLSSNDYPLPRSDPPPVAKPLNKARINEFAALLSTSVHLTPPAAGKSVAKNNNTPVVSSPARSDEQSFSSIPSATSDRESFHTVLSDPEVIKRHIDARYNERIDDRKSIQVKTANIKAIFEEKISTANRTLSQSTDHLSHPSEIKSSKGQTKKIPVNYDSVKRSTISSQPHRHKMPMDSTRYSDHLTSTKDVVIEDKQPENGHEPIDSFNDAPIPSHHSPPAESLLAREIRQAQEKEEELKRQRKKCGLNSEVPLPSKETSTKNKSSPVKSSSFQSNLDFFTSKTNHSLNESSSTTTSSPRRPTVTHPNTVYDSQSGSSSISSPPLIHEEFKQINNIVSQELHRFNDNGVPIIRSSSTNVTIQRSASNQNILSSNIIQREIEAIRAKESELRQLGRIQHTSDEHSDPRKYQECLSTLTKSQSIQTISMSKTRRNSGNQSASRHRGPVASSTSNGFAKHKSNGVSTGRAKFSHGNSSTPMVVNKPVDQTKLSLVERLELEKRQCQEREQELKKQRHMICVVPSSTSSTVNSDSGNVSQEEHEEDQERYFDKIQRLKRTETEKAQAPFVRPPKKVDMSQKWEQMLANRNDE